MLSFAEVSKLLIQYILPIEIIFGTVGNLFNILIFTRTTLRFTSCSFYFLCASIANLLVIYPTLVLNLIKNNYSIDPVTSSQTFCKLYTYLTNVIYILPEYFIVLATVDRYCLTSSNANYRKLSQLRNARYSVVSIILFFLTLTVHILFYYVLEYGYCMPQPGFYTQFTILFDNIVYSYVPPSLLFLFGLLTLLNIKQHRRRIMPIVQRRQQRTDSQLMKMLIVQILVFFMLVMPITIFYIVSTFFVIQMTEQMTLILAVTEIFFYGNYCASFYANTLASNLYRNELKKIFQRRFGEGLVSQAPDGSIENNNRTMTANTIQMRELAARLH